MDYSVTAQDPVEYSPLDRGGGFRIGCVSVEVSGSRDVNVILAGALAPFRFQTKSPDIQIHVENVPNLLRTSKRKIFDSGSIWRLYEDAEGFQFDFSAPFFGEHPYKRLLVDQHFRAATLLTSEAAFLRFPSAVSPIDSPLDELLITHRLTQEKAIELHGCGMVSANGVGNLFVGHSGAGKSTTTQMWTASEDVEILSDDRIIVREHPGHMRMYGTPWHGEAMYASPASAPLTRILVLEHGHGNVLTRLSPSQAVAELFARSFVPMHRHEYVESALAFLEQLAESVPCYRYSFEPDQRAVDTILNLHD
jgi:hypothetical protein